MKRRNLVYLFAIIQIITTQTILAATVLEPSTKKPIQKIETAKEPIKQPESAKTNDPYIDIFKNTLSLFTAPSDPEATKTLEELDKHLKSGGFINFLWSTKLEGQKLIQTITLSTKNTKYSEITTFNHPTGIVFSVNPGIAAKTILYKDVNSQFNNSLIKMIKQFFLDKVNESSKASDEIKKIEQIINNWQPKSSEDAKIAEAIYEWSKGVDLKFQGKITKDELEGNLSFKGGLSLCENNSRQMKQKLNNLSADRIPQFLCNITSPLTANELADAMLKSGVLNFNTKQAADLASTIEEEMSAIKAAKSAQ